MKVGSYPLLPEGSGAVWKSRWTCWAPVSNKQHFNNSYSRNRSRSGLASARLSLKKLWSADTVLWLCPSRSIKMNLVAAHLRCSSHCGGDSIALGIVFHFPTSWDLGPRQYLFGDNSALNYSKQSTAAAHNSGFQQWKMSCRVMTWRSPTEAESNPDTGLSSTDILPRHRHSGQRQ